MQKKPEIATDFIQLARTALTGRVQDVQLLIHRATKNYRGVMPEMADSLIALLQEAPTRGSPLRRQADTPIPVDLDSRFQLLRVEEEARLEHELVLMPEVEASLNQLIVERQRSETLLQAGLQPTKSVLFTGPPGVGKTMAAKWIANSLNRPLLTLDLSAVMSSYLGRTGNNIRHVLDYAKSIDCVLLLDELDAIAKRRDDGSEVGELKRLVTVLLQEIDDWPSSGLLLAATNHADLLDPAVWRRFELALEFSMPDQVRAERMVSTLLKPYLPESEGWSKILSLALKGKSFSDIERCINIARRTAVIKSQSLSEELKSIVSSPDTLSRSEKIELARMLTEEKIVSQRQAREITGVSRDTIRKGGNGSENKQKEKKK
jgi:SpoVK/Ycf46/Vps4 family AAA+-type ATPase